MHPAEMEAPQPEGLEDSLSKENAERNMSTGVRIITEKYGDQRLPFLKRSHYSVELEPPLGVSAEELEFDDLTYDGEPVEGGHWRTSGIHHKTGEKLGPHVYQLRGRWVLQHRECLEHPEKFRAQWKKK
jgi:hypothetical protein